MNKLQFLQYPQCGTCRKAAKWLGENSVEVVSRHIIDQNPSQQEIELFVEKSGLPITKLFNTSGLRYKELGLKDVVKSASKDELIKLLASEGKLVKRPILVAHDKVLVGFKEAEWKELLLKRE